MDYIKENVKQIFYQAIESVKPGNLIREKVRINNGILEIDGYMTDLSDIKNVYVVGFGKASAFMAETLEHQLGGRITGGAVIVKYGHTVDCKKVRIYEAGHPVPDENTLKHSEKILEIAESANEDDLVICLISGGGSALFESLPKKISLVDLQRLNDVLLKSGADIAEMNTVRRHISKVKGGQFLRSVYPATCISLIISDVTGDPLESIASGPTASDDTTFKDALDVIDKYGLSDRIPSSVLIHLEVGKEGKVNETVKAGDAELKNVNNYIIGNIHLAMSYAQNRAEDLGYRVIKEQELIRGEAREVSEEITKKVREHITAKRTEDEPVCIIYGGETTVTHSGTGKGGRNQELALSAYIHLKDIEPNFVLLSGGTDGTDGPTDAAGAIISNKTKDKVKELNMEPESFLENHDSYHFFEETGDLLKTGPTGTNVMDLVIVLIE